MTAVYNTFAVGSLLPYVYIKIHCIYLAAVPFSPPAFHQSIFSNFPHACPYARLSLRLLAEVNGLLHIRLRNVVK